MKFVWLYLSLAAAAAISKNASSPLAAPTLRDEWTVGVAQLPNIKNELAVDANAEALGYRLVNMSTTATGLKGYLKLKKRTDIYGVDFDSLKLTVDYQAKTRLNVRIEPTNLTDVYVLPDDLVARPQIENGSFESELLFVYHNGSSFGFDVLRKDSGDVLFSTKDNPLVFSNQFIQFNTSLPQNHTTYGLGELIHGLVNRPGDVKTLFANDVGDPIDGNIYGINPIYYDQRYDTNLTHGVYWRTLAIQEVVIGDESLTWRALLGVVDLYFFAGPSPLDVIDQYTQEIGRPGLQPYWALGYHQCRWGYDTVELLEDVVKTMKNFDIPMETIWLDIDYMDTYRDFTNDPHRFPLDKYRRFVDQLHKDGQHYVPMFDAAIYVPNPLNKSEIDYPAFSKGNELDVFLKNPDGSLYIGAVWPGFTVFPDFLNNDTQAYWDDLFQEWYHQIPWDGIWTDMNEPSSFCVGSCGTGRLDQNPITPNFDIPPPNNTYPKGFKELNATDYQRLKLELARPLNETSPKKDYSHAGNHVMPGKGNLNYPPYAINNAQGDHDLATHAVLPNATHADGLVEYDVRNLYGMLQEKAIYKLLLKISPDRRPFIIGRLTFPGSGQHVGHWGGDNQANWEMMYFSMAQAFGSGMTGIPFFGVDVCGFNGNTDMELCSRWMQLGAFFPFYRNHNVLGAIPQEPYRWLAVAEALKTAMAVRYSLLPFFYTLLRQAHDLGAPVLRPLMWAFPHDQSVAGVDNQMMVGEALVVTPVLEPNASTVKGVFPGDEVYYDWYSHEKIEGGSKNHTLEAPLGHIPVHVRGGYVLPLQEPGYTTGESRQNDFSLLVALDAQGRAQGELYWDDGESVRPNATLWVNFTAANRSLVAVPEGRFNVSQPLANITVLGCDRPKQVRFNDKRVPYKFENHTLVVHGLQNYTGAGAWSQQFVLEY